MGLTEKILQGSAADFEKQIEDKLPSIKLKTMFKKCYLNTLETTVKANDDSVFVITGDIDAMWLRDSCAQVRQYLPLSKNDKNVQKLFENLIAKQISFILIDPYANAFNPAPNKKGHSDDITQMNSWVFERKYEIDSLCNPVALAFDFYKESGSKAIFTEDFHKALLLMVSQFKKEQNHETSNYIFERRNCPMSDTLKNNGRGTKVSYTGMSWTGFRPSDDAAVYGYNIPENMLLSTALSYIKFFAEDIFKDNELSTVSGSLKEDIDKGIKEFGTVRDKTFGEIYAYETDGLGNYNLMDDANVPSLMAIPYFKYEKVNNKIYENTRKYILSKSNPYYYVGKEASGVGSPHTPKGYIWPIGLIIEALTSTDKTEITRLVNTLIKTDANTDFMHESFNCDNSKEYTRSWFAWANSLFSFLIIKLCNENFDFKKL